MTNENKIEMLQVINEQEVLGKQFRIYGSVRDPLFLAKDVAEWIENKNVSQMLRTVDDDEKGIYNVYTLGGNQEMWFLTEHGLYEVLMQSRKPIAKQFKKEVKHILKQIRLTGGYIPVNEQDTEETINAKAQEIANKTIEEKDNIIAMQQAQIEQQQAQIEQLQAENEVKEDEVLTFMNDIRYLFNKTYYGVHSVSEAFEIVTNNVNGKRRFVKWFKENNEDYVDILDSYEDERGSKIKNAIDLTDINVFHRFKDLCFEFLKQENKNIR